jgi:ferrous iron transport protein B
MNTQRLEGPQDRDSQETSGYNTVIPVPKPEDALCFKETVICSVYNKAEEIASIAVRRKASRHDLGQTIDNIVTSPVLGFPIMLLLLAGILWLTISGANYPSEILAAGFGQLEKVLARTMAHSSISGWFQDMLIQGLFRTTAWVISVMFPPMAIFFPMLTLLENLGYLPRVAFNLDRLFKGAGAHGKQALTMCMGFGCNAVGVVSCRIIDSPRERLIAILTNNFMPCNGRFPLLITLASIFAKEILKPGGVFSTEQSLAVITVVGVMIIGILVTLCVSWLLSRTVLRGTQSGFALELPPYRLPQLWKIVVRSLIERTLLILARAVVVAAPAGVITWLLANTNTGGSLGSISLLTYGARLLDPIGQALGMDGFILMGFLLGLPANEIVLPITLMGYLSTGTMVEVAGVDSLHRILIGEQKWSTVTCLSVMLFSLLHYPCGTTLLTIAKETKAMKWTLLSAIIPLGIACSACFGLNLIARLLGLR